MISCVYKITCIVNNKFYIGCTKNIETRWKIHLYDLKKRLHHNGELQKDFSMYGEYMFTLEIIERCELKYLRIKEKEYIDLLKPEYNLPVAKYWLGKKFTEEVKNKFREVRKGKKHNNSTKQKMRETALNLNRFDSLKKYIENKGNICFDNLGNEFKTLLDASKYHGISQQTVCDILKGRHNQTRKGVKFYYKDNKNEI